MRRPGILGAALALVLSGPAFAQDPALGPLGDPEFPLGVTRAELDAALPARDACRGFVDIINDAALRWERMREGTLQRDGFTRQRDADAFRLDSVKGACGKARLDLPEGKPRTVLDSDVERLLALHGSLAEVEARWLADADTAEVNEAMTAYRAAAERYAAWAAAAETFWRGGPSRDAVRAGCVGDISDLVDEVAADLRALVVQAPRPEDALLRLSTKIDAVQTHRSECTPESDAARVELDLLGRLLDHYSKGLGGLLSGDESQVKAAMAEEQATVRRRARCRAEHADGAAGTLCRPGSAP